MNDGWDALGIKIEGSPGIEMWMDDLALGNTYHQIVPDFLNSSSTIEVDNVSIDLYPNPAVDELTIEVDRPILPGYVVEISNSSGALVEKRSIVNAKQLVVDVSDWIPGVYFVTFRSNQGNKTTMFIKK